MRSGWTKTAPSRALGALLLLLPAAALHATPPRTVGFRESARVAIGHAPVGLALGDLTGDGAPDVVVVNDDSTLTWLFADGGGGLGALRDMLLGADLLGLALGDVDHDGLLDAVVSSPTAGTVFTLIGDRRGNFNGPISLRGPWSPGALALLLDRSLPDLVVADLFFQGLVVAGNAGGGSFAFSRQLAGFIDPVSIAVGDMNRDAYPDVAVADAASHTATVVIDLESSALAARFDQPLEGRPLAVALGDLDRDGRDDLVAATENPGALAVCRAGPDGSFGPARAFPAGPAPVALVLGDFDADGRLDAALADSANRSIGIWVGRGDGTFLKLGDVPTDLGPVGLAMADMNGDGWPDLVCANHDDATVQVFLNTSVLAAGSLRLFAPTPNPAYTTARLTFALSASTSVRLELYDLTGRLVRRLVDGVVMSAGPHDVIWDGRTDAGDRARSGLYLARLRAGGAEAATRLALQR
jgi:hypothetical protein